MYGCNLMQHFIKYYSYNQLIEKFDILVMTQEQFIQNKDLLDNPQVIVAVKRQSGPKEPKMPQWFKQWSEQVYEKRQPQWFKQWSEQVYEKKPPKWFEAYKKEADARFEKIEAKLDEIKEVKVTLNDVMLEIKDIKVRLDNIEDRLDRNKIY